jgi:hypothetical protein
MKPILLPLLFILVSMTTVHTLNAQTPDITGRWVLNLEKSKLEDMSKGFTGSLFIIEQQGKKIKLTRYHYFGEKKNKIAFRMKADGSTRRVKILFRGKLEKKENSLQATLWRKNFLNIVNYRLANNGNELIADEVFTGLPRDHHSVWVFEREK